MFRGGEVDMGVGGREAYVNGGCSGAVGNDCLRKSILSSAVSGGERSSSVSEASLCASGERSKGVLEGDCDESLLA